VEQRRRAESESTGSERFCVSVNDCVLEAVRPAPHHESRSLVRGWPDRNTASRARTRVEGPVSGATSARGKSELKRRAEVDGSATFGGRKNSNTVSPRSLCEIDGAIGNCHQFCGRLCMDGKSGDSDTAGQRQGRRGECCQLRQ